MSVFQTRQANLKSINEEKRTIDLIWSTGAAVKRFGVIEGSPTVYHEELSLKPDHVRLGRLTSGAPLLRNHNSKDQVGVVESAELKDGQGLATVRFSNRKSVDDDWQDVKDKITRSNSVGYQVHKYRKVGDHDDGHPIYRAIDWEPFEISLVSIPADPGAQIRSQDLENPTNPQEMPLPQAQLADLSEERQRSAKITELASRHHIPIEKTQEWISSGQGLDKVRTEILEHLAEKQPTIRSTPPIESGIQDIEKRALPIADALLQRTNPEIKLEGESQKYRGLSMIDVIRHLLEKRQISTTGLSYNEIVSRSFASNSDFKIILDNVMNKSLRDQYQSTQQTFWPLVRRSSFNDFKAKTLTQVGEIPELLPLEEDGEYKSAKLKTDGMSYSLGTFGRKFGLTRKVIINDDLGAFTNWASKFTRAAADLQSEMVWGLIYSSQNPNGKMPDGTPLFSAQHQNLAKADNLDMQGLAKARRQIKDQTNMDGKRIRLTPRYLVVGHALEAQAEQLLATNFYPNEAFKQNVVSRGLKLIVEPLLTPEKEETNTPYPWFIACDPAQIDMIEVAYLRGQEGLYFESRQGFDIDGYEYKARMDFGAAVIDWRGFYKNPGIKLEG